MRSLPVSAAASTLERDAFDALASFREAVLADAQAQQVLAAEPFWPRFVEAAAAWSAARGIPLTPDALELLGSLPQSRLPATEPVSAWPPPQWLPVHADCETGIVEWSHFGGARLIEPFFEDSSRQARLLPFNRLVKWRTGVSDFTAAPRNDGLTPSGFIFHMSRCGSTLVSQMLAAAPEHIVVSEPPPLDAIVQHAARHGRLLDDETIGMLQAMVAALGRDQAGDAKRYFLKLDAWHAAAIPLFRRAFPDIPWAFLYRDPVEVIVSHLRQRGMHTVPGLVAAELVGGPAVEVEAPGARHIARVLRTICAAAIEAAPLGGGLFVDYSDLPGALFTRILPHFNVSPTAAQRDAMAAASRLSAKRPEMAFEADGEQKRLEASDEVRAAAALLDDVAARLEILRRRGRDG